MFFFSHFLSLILYARLSDAVLYKSDATTIQFKEWYPQYGYTFNEILAQHCTEQYESYLTRIKDTDRIDRIGGGDRASALTQPVIQCLLNNTADYVKIAMQSAQVLLGVTPTILAILGSSYAELALLNVVAKRPLLGVLLALGSPSVYMSRAFEYTDPVQLLQDRSGRLRQRSWSGWRLGMILLGEYVIALGAIANIATINWQLGIKTVCSFWSDNIIAPILWSSLVIVAHVMGVFLLRLQIRRVRPSSEIDDAKGTSNSHSWAGRLGQTLLGWLRNEFQSTCCQYNIRVTVHREGYIVVIFSWILSTLVVCHVIYGTIVLASLYFIGPRDALQVIGRLIGSVLACRVVCMFEIAGLRENTRAIMLEFESPEDRVRYEPKIVRSQVVVARKQDSHQS